MQRAQEPYLPQQPGHASPATSGHGIKARLTTTDRAFAGKTARYTKHVQKALLHKAGQEPAIMSGLPNQNVMPAIGSSPHAA